MAGDAIGNLTPLGLLASEPTKILMVRTRISTVTSVASVDDRERCSTRRRSAPSWSPAPGCCLQRANVPDGLERIAEVGLAAIVAAAHARHLGGAHAAGDPVAICAARVRSLPADAEAPAEAIREVEAQIYAVPQLADCDASRTSRPGQIAFHIAAVAEVWVVLAALVPDVTIAEAFLLESAGRFVTVAFKFVPYRLGIDEAGSGAVAAVLGLSPGDRRDARTRPTPAHHDPQCVWVDTVGQALNQSAVESRQLRVEVSSHQFGRQSDTAGTDNRRSNRQL